MQHTINLTDEQETALQYAADLEQITIDDKISAVLTEATKMLVIAYNQNLFEQFMNAPDTVTKADIVSNAINSNKNVI